MKGKANHTNAVVRARSAKAEGFDIASTTASYEAWMRSCAHLLQSDLRLKHDLMKKTPFGFLRGTFYRWAQLWPSVCSDLCGAPKVLAVGDLHVNIGDHVTIALGRHEPRRATEDHLLRQIHRSRSDRQIVTRIDQTSRARFHSDETMASNTGNRP